MIIKAIFTYNGEEFCYEHDASTLPRNYNDEPYALFFVEQPNNKNGIFEINILKDAEVDGILQENGYVAVYDDFEDDVNAKEILDAEIIFEFDKDEDFDLTKFKGYSIE